MAQHTRPRGGRPGLLMFIGVIAGASVMSAGALAQLPTNGVVTGGSATITQNSSTQLTINHTTTRGVINWQSIYIGTGMRLGHVQPGTAAVTLNRVVGPDPSIIAGGSTLNVGGGRIMPTVVFATGAVLTISAAGSVGSARTLTVAAAPSSGAGGVTANRRATTVVIGTPQPAAATMTGGAMPASGAPANTHALSAAIARSREVTVRDGGLVGLAGARVANDRVIGARLGHARIGDASAVTVDLAGDGLLGLQIGTVPNAAKPPTGAVTISAATARGVVDAITNVRDMAQATSVGVRGGAVVFGGN